MVTVSYGGLRMDPILCTIAAATCIANGWTVNIGANSQPTPCPSYLAGWCGTFAITGTVGNWKPDGTGGTSLVYTDAINNPNGTLCDNSGSTPCSGVGGLLDPGSNTGDVTFASLAFKITDIVPGDDVYVYGCTVSGTPQTTGYEVGAVSSVYAITGTIPTGLTVVYQVAAQPIYASAQCMVSNRAGFPKNITFQNNTVLAVNAFDILVAEKYYQPISNYFFNNVFADNDSDQGSDLDCTPVAHGEGYPSYPCFDLNTFQFYGNALGGRSSANWNSGIPVPSTQTANTFPSLSGSYPSAACPTADAPFNCPLMALPWSTNFNLSDVGTLSPSGISASQGVNVTTMQQRMTETLYPCPSGANCGSHGPYPDN